ncbi:MAG TPA: hypothetical protein VK846_04560 [Candidatus Limnocylindria bacterium]|nr:hypothetical protein [Candidatus Limnocylindria bacterium]
MKSLMILGGLIGLSIGLLFGLADSGQWPAALWRACAAALIGGVMLRWWGRVWVRSLRDAAEKRLAAPPAEQEERSTP